MRFLRFFYGFLKIFCVLSFLLVLYLTPWEHKPQTNTIRPPEGEISIVVRKPILPFTTGVLEIRDVRGLWKSYPVTVGTVMGDKIRKGDKRTPEGVFYICAKHQSKKFRLSLGLSYPSRVHADRGLKNGSIDQATHRRIQHAWDHKEMPPWDTPLGGEIMIHGGGLVKLWMFYASTNGCVRMDDTNMSEVYALAKIGTQVTIL